MNRKDSENFSPGVVKIYNPLSKKLQQVIEGEGDESLGYSWDADGEWLAIGCPTYTHVGTNSDATIPCLGRVKIYKAYHQKNAANQFLYYDSSGNETTTASSNSPYIKYEKFGPDILGEIFSETNRNPEYQFFGYCVKIEKAKKMGYKSKAKMPEDRYPHIAIGAPFRGYDHPNGFFRHEMVGAIYLFHPVYLNELLDESAKAKQIEKQASKIFTFAADGSIATETTVGEREPTFTSAKTSTDVIGNKIIFKQ